MDDWLDDIGLYRKNTALDGSCMFRAVAEQLMPANPINGHLALRKFVVDFMRKNRHLYEDKVCGDFDEYLDALSLSKGWGSALELDAISLIYHVDFVCFFGPEKPLKVTKNNFAKDLMLCVTGDSYYDAVYKKSYISDLGFCQSIVYKILYEEVFKLTDLDYAVDKMLHDKAARAQRERYLHQQCVATGRDDLCFDYLEDPGATVNVRKVIDSGAILFPYKVAKALDRELYRNIDFDVWFESQRVTRRNNYWASLGGPLRVGAKCQVRYDGATLTGFIQDLPPDKGPAVVFIEELSQNMTVPYDSLVPLPRSSLKPDWSYSHKNQMISKFGQRSGRENSVETTVNQSKGRRGQRDGSASIHNQDLKNSSVTISEADSTVLSPTYAPGPKLVQHSLIHTPDDIWLVDKSATSSTRPDGSDLPLNDLTTLRFFYNMGIEYFNKGVYVVEPTGQDNEGQPFPTPENSPLMAKVCQGAPLIQPPPPVHPPPLVVDPMTPMLVPPPPPLMTVPPPSTAALLPPPPSTLTPPPSTTALPIPQNNYSAVTYVTGSPLLDEDNSFQSLKISDTPVAPPREGKGRGSRFNKPPRFQRLESAAKAASMQRASENVATEDVQNPEISSCTGQEPMIPVAVVPPIHIGGSTPPYVRLENDMIISDMPYLETTPYTEYNGNVVPQTLYIDPEGNYPPYYMYNMPYYYQ